MQNAAFLKKLPDSRGSSIENPFTEDYIIFTGCRDKERWRNHEIDHLPIVKTEAADRFSVSIE